VVTKMFTVIVDPCTGTQAVPVAPVVKKWMCVACTPSARTVRGVEWGVGRYFLGVVWCG
jgi:hypothetical protein